jgi:hypothetical protein
VSAQVDHDLLADFVGGALEGTPTHGRIAHLVATDPSWRRAAEQLTTALHATSLDLDRLRRTPEPMPADVAERISAALAPAPAPTPVRRPARQTFFHKLRWAVPIAAVAGAFAFFALKLPVGMPTQSGVPARGTNGIAADSATGAEIPVPTITSGQQHDRTNLRDSGRTNGGEAAPKAAASDGRYYGLTVPGLQRLTDPHALRLCLDAVAVVLPGKATLVDYAYFEGRPALVISITATSGKWTFVAGPDCGIAGPDEIYRTPLQ